MAEKNLVRHVEKTLRKLRALLHVPGERLISPPSKRTILFEGKQDLLEEVEATINETFRGGLLDVSVESGAVFISGPSELVADVSDAVQEVWRLKCQVVRGK